MEKIKILFQGDSITDAGRCREDYHDLGGGYPYYAAAMISDAYPDVDFEFINLGVGGNRTENLVERLQGDFINIQPNIVSIMIGINDVWHYFSHNILTTAEQFENNYRTVLQEIKKSTNAKIIMIEPYLLPVEDKLNMRENLDCFINIERKLAREFADAYIPLDGFMAAGCVDKKNITYYSDDGVHPNLEGARYIADIYFHAISPFIDDLIKK